MHANLIAENVFGTMGAFHFPFGPEAQTQTTPNRHHLLDDTANSTDMEELAGKIHARALTVAGVRCSCIHHFRAVLTFAPYSLLWGISTAFLGPYTIILDLNIPLILEPQFFGFLALVAWGQVCYNLHHFKSIY
jgi:hypothetical protein